MNSFDVLSRSQSVHRSLLLEASAGTGKTFAIENSVLRLIVETPNSENNPLPLSKILIVTFTKAATKDLKSRIKSTFEKTLWLLHKYLADGQAELPDYLIAYINDEPSNLGKAKRLIEQALLTFDEAHISTIHSFCWRMLRKYAMEGGMSFNATSKEDEEAFIGKEMRAIRDFMRTELIPEQYHPVQIKILLKKTKGNVEQLCRRLHEEIDKGMKIVNEPSFADLVLCFQEKMLFLKNHWGLESKKILEDFYAYAPSYKGLYDRHHKMHPEIIEKVQRFAALFDKNSWTLEDFSKIIEDGFSFAEAFHSSQLVSKKHPPAKELLHYPHFIENIKEHLDTIIFQAKDPATLFARLIRDCQIFLLRYRAEEEHLGHRDLLIRMQKALENSHFVEKIRNQYSAVIVDEFQDTDPLQWKIFQTLFCNSLWKGYLHLIGDPKQSIYAFRQADIYTYLQAAQALGSDAQGTLDFNFRSQPDLVEALNALFQAVPNLFPLPQKNSSLSYRVVHAGKKENQFFDESGGCLQFWTVKTPQERPSKALMNQWEEKFFFPAMAKEVLRLKNEKNLDFCKCAVLVANKEQGLAAHNYLKKCGIPVRSQKGRNLSKSYALDAVKELIKGILYYRTSSLRIALGGKLIGMTCEEFHALDDEESKARIFNQCESLRNILVQEGFVHFYSAFMQSRWKNCGATPRHAMAVDTTPSILENLLQQKDAFEFYLEWQAIADLLMQEESKRNLSPEGLIQFLDQLKQTEAEEDSRLIVPLDTEQEGVSLLTTHSSKGLEFDVVFAIGMIRQTPSPNDLIPIGEGLGQYFEPRSNHNLDQYNKYCEEIDAEKMRQLYVALTRAKYRVYFPVLIIGNRREQIPKGTASPCSLLLAKLGRDEACYEQLYNRIQNENGNSLKEFVASTKANISQIFLKESQFAMCKAHSENPQDHSRGLLQGSLQKLADEAPILCPPPTTHISATPQFIQSFSSLAAHASRKQEDDDQAMFHDLRPDFHSEINSEHTLPAGPDTGTLLHRILEEIPLKHVNMANSHCDLLRYIEPFLQNSPYAPWKETIAAIIYKALTTFIYDGDRHFRVADIDPKKMYREADFFYSCKEGKLGGKYLEAQVKSGFLKGTIDLFFEYEGKYYLLDWKSNWLGPSSEYYQVAYLEKAMQNHGYLLQATIYLEALRRYLERFNSRPFSEIFGGVFYIFLRGIVSSQGILHLNTL